MISKFGIKLRKLLLLKKVIAEFFPNQVCIGD